MFEYYIWILSFVFLYISIFWIIVLGLKDKKYGNIKEFPPISIIVPAYNEEKGIAKTLDSIFNLDYPKDKVKVIVVDDCSTDNTAEIVKKYKHVKLIRNKIRGGNAAKSVNVGLKEVTTDLFARVDADSYVDKNSLKNLIKCFNDKNVGAVISSILVDNPKNNIEQMQRFEYIITSYTRKLMAKVETLHITNGVLSVYKTKLVRDTGGFEEDNLTEDYEIALRLRKNGYDVVMEPDSMTYTHVPDTFYGFWKQRVRWYRGFITNNIKYRDMLFNLKHGLLGLFQMPVAILSMFLVLVSFVLFSYNIIDFLYAFFYKIITLRWDIFGIPKIPPINEIILGLDVRIYIPVLLSLVFALYIYFMAHKAYNKKRIYPIVTVIYLFFYPILTSFQWVVAFVLEMFRAERKW